MARIIIMGGGWCGPTSALLLHRKGHDVTALEKDAATPPCDPWARAGVVQFRRPRIAEIDALGPPAAAGARHSFGPDREQLLSLLVG